MDTPSTKTSQVEAELRRRLQDGRWHDAKPIREEIAATVGCHIALVTRGMHLIGADIENHFRAGSRWRLTPDAEPHPLPWQYVRKTPDAGAQ